MRLIPNIRFGTERFPEKVARRLRSLNITAWFASATHAFYAAVLLVDVSQYWWLAVANVIAMLIYAGIPLLHRLGPLAAPIAFAVLFYVDLLAYICLLGTGIGIQFYFLMVPALVAMYLGPGHMVLTTSFTVVATVLIIAVQLALPADTGLLQHWIVVVSLVANATISSGVLLLIVSYALGEVARAETVAEREYERSEHLLDNILPSPIAARLKDESNVIIADRHDEASILFADMEGFTAQASDTEPYELVAFLNRVFSDFDRRVEQHGLEKIKTTGDAYIVVSGVPTARSDHAQALAILALEMRETAEDWRDAHGRTVPIRMGFSSGPVVAGVVGTRKFFYDVWGDAVNVAARMETTGIAGKVQVSPEAYEYLKENFVLEERGWIDVKGKGRMRTWFLVAPKSG